MKEERKNKRNRRQEEEIRAFLKSAEQPEIDGERKRQTLELLRMERKWLHIRSRKPYIQRVLDQTAYLSPAVWLIQGALVLILGWSFCVGDRREILINLLLCAPIIGIVGFTEIMRSYRQSMWELEQACRYNLRQLMGMRLLIFGIVDSLVACGVTVMGFGAGIWASELLGFFFIPQILSDCVYLYLMARFRQRFQGITLLGAAVFMTLLWVTLLEGIAYDPQLRQRIADPFILALLLLACLGLLALCCVRFLKGVEAEYCGA